MKKRAWWPLLRRSLTLGFILLVAGLLLSLARSIEWAPVLDSLRRTDGKTLALAAVFAAASHLLYSCFDLLGRAYTQHKIPASQVMAIGQVSYAFNLNLGALIGGFAFRFRLYSRFGLKRAVTARILSLSLATNWLGYMFLAGCVFVTRSLVLPTGWAPGAAGLQLLGGILLMVVAAYLLACAISRKRSWRVRGAQLHLPSIKMAALQLLLSTINWLLIAGVVFTLLQGKIAFPTVLGVLLSASIAGVIAHIPAGLGVIEAVFLAFLQGVMPQGQILAALLVYRVLYYLGPLALAVALYLGLEARAKTREAAAT